MQIKKEDADLISYHEHEKINDIQISNAAVCDQEFVECKFENCHFETLDIKNCKFIDCSFIKCVITNPTFDYCTMSGNDFLSCRLFGINWDHLSSGFVAPVEHLEDCQLKYNNFVNVHFSRFTFSGNDILDSLFGDCNLSHSKFSSCHLNRTEFFRCDLTGADFENAEGYKVDISNCKLKGAVFSFPEVINLLHDLPIIIK